MQFIVFFFAVCTYIIKYFCRFVCKKKATFFSTCVFKGIYGKSYAERILCTNKDNIVLLYENRTSVYAFQLCFGRQRLGMSKRTKRTYAYKGNVKKRAREWLMSEANCLNGRIFSRLIGNMLFVSFLSYRNPAAEYLTEYAY